jgi:hypothetical protein
MFKFLTNMSIGRKISLLTAFTVVLGIAVFSFLGLRAVNQATDTMLEERLTTARLMASYIDEALNRAMTQVAMTAGKVDMADPAALDDLVTELDATCQRLSMDLYDAYIVDGDGTIVWADRDPLPAGGLATASLAGFTAAADRTVPEISGLVSAPETGEPVVLLSQPLAGDAGGDTGGSLVVAIDLAGSGVSGFIQPVRLGQTGYVELIDQNGIVVARTNPGPPLNPFEQSDHSGKFAELIAAGKPTQGVCHTCHQGTQAPQKQDVLAFMPLSVAPWGVVVRQAESEALAPARDLRQSLIIYGGGLCAVALLFVFVTTRDVGSRIRVLTGASRNIAEGDLVTPVAVLGRDEVGILA